MYADSLSKGLVPNPTSLLFFVKRPDGTLGQIEADLDIEGSLAPLFIAFGLITLKEASQIFPSSEIENNDKDLFEFLSNTAEEAAAAGQNHDELKRTVRNLRRDLEARYGFASITLGGEFSVGGESLKQQIESLEMLGLALDSYSASDLVLLQGINLRLHHPDFAPMVTTGFKDNNGIYNVRSEPLECRVTESGIVHLVAFQDPARVFSAIQKIDFSRAKLMTKVRSFWLLRSRDLAEALKKILNVKNVWFDSRGDMALRRFVLWAGSLIEYLGMRSQDDIDFSTVPAAYSILIHSEESSPLLEYVASSSLLQISSDCPPDHLIQFMNSEDGILANQSAAILTDGKEKEEEALAAVKTALGAKAVVRLCSSQHRSEVLEAVQKLIDAAPSIRATIDLRNVSIAIDDCYDVWDSGFVSIPYDFSLVDLEPKLVALLGAPGNENRSHPSTYSEGKVSAFSNTIPKFSLTQGRFVFGRSLSLGRRSKMAIYRRNTCFFQPTRLSLPF